MVGNILDHESILSLILVVWVEFDLKHLHVPARSATVFVYAPYCLCYSYSLCFFRLGYVNFHLVLLVLRNLESSRFSQLLFNDIH